MARPGDKGLRSLRCSLFQRPDCTPRGAPIQVDVPPVYWCPSRWRKPSAPGAYGRLLRRWRASGAGEGVQG
eukprot:7806305-Pyramimonas_sp.AAC.2